MPNRVISKPYQLPNPNPQNHEELSLGSSADFLSGLITDADPLNIPDNALQNCLNIIYTRGLLLRRNGLLVYPIAKPDSLKIMAVFLFFETKTGVNLLRFTPSSIYRAGSTGWVQFTPTAVALAGTNIDYFQFTVIENRGFFTNDGANVVMEILPATQEYSPLGNSPQAKYITSAFDRVIVASIVDVVDIPYRIQWSGNLNFDEWDPLIDESAGFTDFVDSSSDLSDDITGIYNLASVICITRQRSIWLATHTGSASQPFSFFIDISRVGADTPRTIVLREKGLIFFSFQTSSVLFYTPQNDLVDISIPIKRYLKSQITAIDLIWGTYNYDTECYTLFIGSNSSSTVLGFTYNFLTKTWSIENYLNISATSDLDYPTSSVSIDELLGTISGLSGTIDSLGGLVANSSRFIGDISGNLYTQPVFFAFESQAGDILLDDNGTSFETIIQGKTYQLPIYNQYLNLCRIGVTPFTVGSIVLEYSKDDSHTWTAYKTVTFITGQLFKNQIITGNKLINTRRFTWRIRTTDCMFVCNRFDSQLAPAGISGI